MQSNKSIYKKIITVMLLLAIVCASTLYVTHAWFVDKESADITINVAKMSATVTTSDTLSPSDLIAGKTFNKTINVNLVTDFNIYLRVYAVVSVSDAGENYNSTSLITTTAVSGCKQVGGGDEKYYYTIASSVSSVNNLTSLNTNTYNFVFSFKVDNSVNEDTFASGSTTKIDYYFEYCQIEGATSWFNS